MRTILSCLAAVTSLPSLARADLYATAGVETATFYLLSTDDASAQLLASNPDAWGHFELALGPDGHHYSVSSGLTFDIVDPVNAWSQDILCLCAQQWPTGGMTVSPEGVAYIGMIGFTPSIWGWNIFTGSSADGADFGEQQPTWSALQWRDDGLLIGAEGDPATIFEIDVKADRFTPLGELPPSVGLVVSFARETTTGLTYMLAEDDAGLISLYLFDPFTLETGFIGTPPPELSITGIAGIPLCPTDFNADGELDTLDFVAYQQAFLAGEPAADLNGDGALDVFDFVAFHELFLKGCP